MVTITIYKVLLEAKLLPTLDEVMQKRENEKCFLIL